jgi:hypothetical protein
MREAVPKVSSIVYFSFNLLGPSILGKSTEITVTKNNIFETDKKNTLDLLEQLKQNNEHNIVYQNKILELDSGYSNLKDLNKDLVFNVLNLKGEIVKTKSVANEGVQGRSGANDGPRENHGVCGWAHGKGVAGGSTGKVLRAVPLLQALQSGIWEWSLDPRRQTIQSLVTPRLTSFVKKASAPFK